MTGIKIKVLRGAAQWVEIDVDDLVDPDEWDRMIQMERRWGRDGWQIVQALVKWIKANRLSSPV